MDSSYPRPRLLLGVALLASTLTAIAAEGDPQPISLDADSSTFDRQSNTVVFRRLTITQGGLSIRADEAVATGLDFEQGEWRLTGNVSFALNSARIAADSARMTFVANELQSAELLGEPATLEETGEPGADPVRGGANRLVYDNVDQLVHMLGGAWFSSGQNEFRGCDLVYDLDRDRITAGSSDCGEPVLITILPRDGEDGESTTAP